jgi:hypothetical protein
MLALPASICIHNVFHVYLLKNYVPDTNHVIDWNMIQVEPKGNFQVKLVCILDRKIKNLWNQSVGLVKVQWTWCGLKDETWEHEDSMQAEYPHIFQDFYNALRTVYK